MLAVAVAATLIAAAQPAAAQTSRPYNAYPNTIKLRVGLFQPNGDSQYWDQREIDFTGDEDDFDDTIFGVDYTHMLTERSRRPGFRQLLRGRQHGGLPRLRG